MPTKSKLHVDFCKTDVLLVRSYAEEPQRSYVENQPSGKCWLCEQQRPAVTFKKEAHVLPQGLGNKGWLTHDECDRCNELIGRYESALVASLAPYRLTSSYKPRRLKFKDPRSGSFLSSDQAKNIFVSESAPSGGLAEVKSESEILLRVPIDGHRPLSICKALARIPLLLIPETRRSHRHLRKWLLRKLILPEQALVCGQLKDGEIFDPGIVIHRRVGGDGRDIAVSLTYEGTLYWYVLPRNLEVVASVFFDHSMIEALPDISWTANFYTEESAVTAYRATIIGRRVDLTG